MKVMIRRLGNKIKPYRKIFIFIMIFSWFFSGWPPIWQNPRIPIEVFAEETTTPTTESAATSTTPAVELAELAEQSGKIIEEEIEEEETPESEEFVELPPPSPQPRLSVRVFTKHITLDKGARHSCEAETFHIDMSNQTGASVRINLWRNTAAPDEMEIGSLPLGIDITFVKNGRYLAFLGSQERAADLTITKQEGAQRGNFSIPIVYTKKGGSDSSVICQLNIVNL